MINLEQLEDARAEAQTDKTDLFDFYHDNWDKLIAELRTAQDRLKAIELHHDLRIKRAAATQNALKEGKRVV